jgi:hypothetical protein
MDGKHGKSSMRSASSSTRARPQSKRMIARRRPRSKIPSSLVVIANHFAGDSLDSGLTRMCEELFRRRIQKKFSDGESLLSACSIGLAVRRKSSAPHPIQNDERDK